MEILHSALFCVLVRPIWLFNAVFLTLFQLLSLALQEDALVFDAVLALGSTLKAAELLGIPQSSISRRYRNHAASIHVDVVRGSDGFQVTRGQFLVGRLRKFALTYRAYNQLNRYAVHPALLDFLGPKTKELPGQLLRLGQPDWGHWLGLEVIDSLLDCQIIADPAVASSVQASPALVVEIAHPPALSVAGNLIARRVYLGDLALIKGLPEAVESFGWEVVAFKHPDHALAFLRPLRCSRSLPFHSLSSTSQFNVVANNRPPAGRDDQQVTRHNKVPSATKQSVFSSIPPTWQLDPSVDVLVGLVWTHSAVYQEQDPEVLRKLSEFQFVFQSFIDSRICNICSSYMVDCPNPR